MDVAPLRLSSAPGAPPSGPGKPRPRPRRLRWPSRLPKVTTSERTTKWRKPSRPSTMPPIASTRRSGRNSRNDDRTAGQGFGLRRNGMSRTAVMAAGRRSELGKPAPPTRAWSPRPLARTCSSPGTRPCRPSMPAKWAPLPGPRHEPCRSLFAWSIKRAGSSRMYRLVPRRADGGRSELSRKTESRAPCRPIAFARASAPRGRRAPDDRRLGVPEETSRPPPPRCGARRSPS